MKTHQQQAPKSTNEELQRSKEWAHRCFRRLARYTMPLALLISAPLFTFSQAAAAPPSPQQPIAPSTATPAPAAPESQDATKPLPQAPPQNPALSAVDNSKYVIGSDDILLITVWREPTLSGSLPVRPDGMISLVLIGDIKATGRTPMQLGDDITQRLKKYIQDPSVTVAVTAVNSQRVYMVGEVLRVGPIPLTPGMTPLQAISAAGGPSPYANTKRIYILRGSGAQQQKIFFNYKKALKGDNQPGTSLQPGDTIVLP